MLISCLQKTLMLILLSVRSFLLYLRTASSLLLYRMRYCTDIFDFVLYRLLGTPHLCDGMKLQAVQRVVKLQVPPQARKSGIQLPVIHQQELQHLAGTHLVMRHQAMEVPLPVHAKIDGMKPLKQKEVLMANWEVHNKCGMVNCAWF